MSKGKLWTARIMCTLATLFLLFDAVIHILRIDAATSSLAALGYNPNVSLWLGITLLASLILFIMPRTTLWGALLITGYLGGAVATNVRVEAPLFNLFFPVIVAVFLWSGPYVASPRLRALLCSKINS